MQEETRTGKSRRIPLNYTTIILALAAAALLIVWLVVDDRQTTTPPLPEPPAPQMTDADLFEPGHGDPAAIREGDRARAFIANLSSDGSDPDPNSVFVEAMRLQGEEYAVDAYLLFRFAARHGHGQAALVLGNQADPAYRNADIPDWLKNQPEQAYKWYSIAAERGVDEAAERLQALREHVEQSALNGDEHAQRLLLQWR